MPRHGGTFVTFQPSIEERKLLDQYCEQEDKTKTQVLRDLVRGLKDKITFQGRGGSQ